MSLALTAMLLALVPQDDEKAIREKQAGIAAFLKTAKTERAFRAAVNDLTNLADKAESINAYDLAAKLYKHAERIARVALKDSALAKSFTDSAKRSLDVGRKYKRAEKAYFRVEDGKGTPEDHLIVGKFICFVKGGWEVGLRSLAEGSDKKLKALADRDLYGNESKKDKIALGDSWAALAKKEPAAVKRAVHWYAKAWPRLSGIAKEKLRSKLHAIQQRRGPSPSKGPSHTVSEKLKGRVLVDETRSVGQ